MDHILVVDDNPEIREILHILLGGEGYCIEEASNGMLALEKLPIRLGDTAVCLNFHRCEFL